MENKDGFPTQRGSWIIVSCLFLYRHHEEVRGAAVVGKGESASIKKSLYRRTQQQAYIESCEKHGVPSNFVIDSLSRAVNDNDSFGRRLVVNHVPEQTLYSFVQPSGSCCMRFSILPKW